MNCKHGKAHKVIRETGVIIYRCDFCDQELQSFKRRLTNFYVIYNFYTSRGDMFLAKFEGIFNSIGGIGVGFLLLQGYLGKLPSFWLLPLLYIVRQSLSFFLGYKDYKKWKISQRESVFGIRYNPQTVEMFKRIKNIERKVAPDTFDEKGVLDWYKDDEIKVEDIKK